MKVKLERLGAACQTDRRVRIKKGAQVEVPEATAVLWLEREPGLWRVVEPEGWEPSELEYAGDEPMVLSDGRVVAKGGRVCVAGEMATELEATAGWKPVEREPQVLADAPEPGSDVASEGEVN